MDSLWTALTSFADQFVLLLTPGILIASAVSVLLGVIVGAMPGLTATLAVSLLVGLTFGFDATMAITTLIGIYIGGVYGGSQTAILLNIPGTPASAATALEGHPLAKEGLASEAIGIATFSSFIGTLSGALMILLLSPPLSSVALMFGAWEYFLLAIFGVMVCGIISGDNPLKGWTTGAIGLFLALVGIDELHAYSRFTFGSVQLLSGISLIPAMIGLFAVPEILGSLGEKSRPSEIKLKGKSSSLGLSAFKSNVPTALRSGAIGILIGAVPGAGADISAWISYAFARRFSKKPEEYGKGSREGLIAAEVANSTAVGGTMIPLLTLAVPGGAVSAVILGALWIHDIRPGPLMFSEFPDFSYQIAAMFVLSALFLLITGLAAARMLPLLLKVPTNVLMPIIAVLCVVGTYAVNIRMFDVYVMAAFGLLGAFLRKYGYPPAPLVLGLILGQLADTNLRRALYINDGSVSPFFTRPISLALIILLTILILSPIVSRLSKRFRRQEASQQS